MECFLCHRNEGKVVLKKTGSYVYEKKEYPIFLCQYCRASQTKFKNKMTTPRSE